MDPKGFVSLTTPGPSVSLSPNPKNLRNYYLDTCTSQLDFQMFVTKIEFSSSRSQPTEISEPELRSYCRTSCLCPLPAPSISSSEPCGWDQLQHLGVAGVLSFKHSENSRGLPSVKLAVFCCYPGFGQVSLLSFPSLPSACGTPNPTAATCKSTGVLQFLRLGRCSAVGLGGTVPSKHLQSRA